MWSTVLKLAPAAVGLLGQFMPSLFSGLAKKAEANPGATNGLFGTLAGFLTNPDVRDILADTLVKFADLLRAGVGG